MAASLLRSRYLCLPEPLRGVSLDEDSFEELSFEELSLDAVSFDPVSDLDLSSFLSLSFDPESEPEEPGEELFVA
jgi:hypothetical protein